MADRWYAIRAVYEHGREDDGTGVFCERVLLFQAPDAEKTVEQAKRESDQYLKLNPEFRRVGEWSAFGLQNNRSHGSGAEVWAMVYLDKRSGEDFYHGHYKKLEIPTDDEG